MVSKIPKPLPVCGQDNPTGYWENRNFRKLNDRILEQLGGTWKDLPEFRDCWLEELPLADELVQSAKKLIGQSTDNLIWGWKDPRNCLTLPFWQKQIPDLKVILAVRNPIEVAMSLQARLSKGNLNFGVTFPSALNLWLAYYRQFLSGIENDQDYVIVHYESLLMNPKEELRRIYQRIDLEVNETKLFAATRIVDPAFRRHRISESFLDRINSLPQITSTYRELCQSAGSHYHSMMEDIGRPQSRTEDDAFSLFRMLIETCDPTNKAIVQTDNKGRLKAQAKHPSDLTDVEIVLVHYRHARPTVATLNALFRHYPDVEVTLVDNSGGLCRVTEEVLPHLDEFAHCIRVIVNPAKEHGHSTALSHGAGIDLARLRCRRKYLLSIESDTFVLGRGCIEYALSLMDAGYDWAGVGQKPVDDTYASFSPCFAIFRVDLLNQYNLSFRRRDRTTKEKKANDLLIRHHRIAADLAKQNLPPLEPELKPPDTYRLDFKQICEIETQHLEYFDTGEWVHHCLAEKGHRGHLFAPPPSLCHIWGSRNEALFIENFSEKLPNIELNDYLPQSLQINPLLEYASTPNLSMLDAENEQPAAHWHWRGTSKGEMSVDGLELRVDLDIESGARTYLAMGDGSFEKPPPRSLEAMLRADTLYRLECKIRTEGLLAIQLFLIEYGDGQRIDTHKCARPHHDRFVIDWVTRSNTDSYRVLFRFSGNGSAHISDLVICGPPIDDD